jgi:hypothetical protein
MLRLSAQACLLRHPFSVPPHLQFCGEILKVISKSPQISGDVRGTLGQFQNAGDSSFEEI